MKSLVIKNSKFYTRSKSYCLISSLIIIDNPIEYFHSRVWGGGGRYSIIWPIWGYAAGLGMVFYLSVPKKGKLYKISFESVNRVLPAQLIYM